MTVNVKNTPNYVIDGPGSEKTLEKMPEETIILTKHKRIYQKHHGLWEFIATGSLIGEHDLIKASPLTVIYTPQDDPTNKETA